MQLPAALAAGTSVWLNLDVTHHSLFIAIFTLSAVAKTFFARVLCL